VGLGPYPIGDEPEDEGITELEAEALVRHLAALESHISTVEANAAALVAADETEIRALHVRHGDALRQFVAAWLTGRKRSWRCLHGVAGFRAVPGRLVVEHEERALAWAREHCPQAIRLELCLRAVGKPADFAAPDPETGEVIYTAPPGLAVVPARDVFYVKSTSRRVAGSDAEE
ncbi:MAG: hypothetical protein Q7T33_02565, partial [Dehalococcoidia bacterium]|nr:hypothetical protein [Dehalococcoidia bacterium]